MVKFEPKFAAFALSEIPHSDVDEACQVMLRNFPEATPVPNLSSPQQSFLALMKFLRGMPCHNIDWERGEASFDLSAGRDSELVEFYERYLSNDLDYFAISPELEPPLYKMAQMFHEKPWPELKLVQINVPGPYTFCHTLRDRNGVPAFYDDTMRDVVVKHLVMKVRWREKQIRELFPGVRTILTAAEAALGIYSSASGTGSWDFIKDIIDEVLQAGEDITCIHCCDNFDWSLLMQTSTGCINLDAYKYGETMALYPDDLGRFLERGGTIAWGIVPTSGSGEIKKDIECESPSSLVERLERIIQLIADKGVDKDLLLRSSWITPSCVPCSLPVALADRVFDFTREVAQQMRQKYFS
jgi:hypothetical protein